MKIRQMNMALYNMNVCMMDGGGGGAVTKKVISDSTKISINTTALTDAIETAELIIKYFEEGNDKYTSYYNTVSSESESFVDYVEENTHYLQKPYSSYYLYEDGTERTSRINRENSDRESQALARIRNKEIAFNEKVTSINNYYTNDIVPALTLARKVKANLEYIRKCVDSFDGLATKFDFGDYLTIALDFYMQKGTYTPNDNEEVYVNQDTDEIEYKNKDTGQTYSGSNRRKEAFVTSTGAFSAYVAVVISEQRNFPPEMTESMIYSAMAETNAMVTVGEENGWFDKPDDMTWDEYNAMRFKEVTGMDWDPEKNRDILNEYFAAIGLDADDITAGLIAAIGGTGGLTPQMATIIAGALTMTGDSLYDFSHDGRMTPEQQEIWAEGLAQSTMSQEDIQAAEGKINEHREAIQQHYDEVVAQQQPTQPQGTPGRSGGGCGGGSPESGVVNFDDYDEITGELSPELQGEALDTEPTIGDKITGMITTSTDFTPVAEAEIPKAIEPDLAKSIDQQAAEIYFNRSPEEIAAERANALSAVDMAFSGENVEAFKDVLRQGGFNDVDIDVIMNNKEIAVTAYILASESKSLTDIANQLAVANNIQNFDTMYDNGLNRMSLENGLSQSKLMAEVDDSVQDARTNVQNARNKYNESVKKANDSIEDAEKKKEEMEAVKKRIIEKSGEDPSKWDDDDVEAYNKAIEEYNKANKLANEAHNEAMNNKELLDQAETNLKETQDKVASDYLNQNSNEPAQEGQTPPGTDSDVEELEDVPSSDIPGDEPTGPTAEEIEPDGPGGEPKPDELTTDDIHPDEDVPTTQADVVTEEEPVVEPVSGRPTGGSVQTHEDVEPERKLTSDDIMSLFDGLDEVSSMGSAERTLDAVDLSSLAPEDRAIPGMGVTDVFGQANNVRGLDPVAHQVTPSENRGEILERNGIAAFADSAAKEANKKTDEFKDNKFNGMSGFSMNTQGMKGLGTTTSSGTSSSASSSGTKKESENKNETVAGVKIEAADVKKHTDGVLVDSDDNKVASEVSEDGRSLEYVEID
ncbi:MAG: hypothetical protein II625_05320 [Bacilli bacterium]|nr:hypothetical protein [Bacilli bacterium]